MASEGVVPFPLVCFFFPKSRDKQRRTFAVGGLLEEESNIKVLYPTFLWYSIDLDRSHPSTHRLSLFCVWVVRFSFFCGALLSLSVLSDNERCIEQKSRGRIRQFSPSETECQPPRFLSFYSVHINFRIIACRRSVSNTVHTVYRRGETHTTSTWLLRRQRLSSTISSRS